MYPRHPTTTAAAVLVGAALAAASCGAPDEEGPAVPIPTATIPSTTPSPGPTPSSRPTPPPAADPADPSASSPADLAAALRSATGRPGDPEVVADGLPLPWSVVALPDGDALVSLRDQATVVRVDTGAGTWAEVPTTSADGTFAGARPQGEGGLLGITLSPDFPADQQLYAYVSRADGNVVVRATYDGRSLGEPEVVLDGIPVGSTHNGGRLAFGPDGMLYVTTGDTREGSLAQDPDSLGGKILRVTPDGGPAPGNPTPGSPVWTLGHRNVQGIGWDSQGRMYATEFGDHAWDELNLVEAGADYGWPVVEGPGGEVADERGFTEPLVWWRPSQASPSGATVTGDAVYLTALRGQRLWRVPVDTSPAGGPVGRPEAFLTGDHGRLRDVQPAPDGSSLWVLTNRGDGDDQLLDVPLGPG